MPKGFVLSDKVLNNKLNSPAYNSKYSYAADKSLNDLDIFTNGQPYDFYKDLRENAPIFYH